MPATDLLSLDAILERNARRDRRSRARRRARAETRAFKASKVGGRVTYGISLLVSASGFIFAMQNSDSWWLRVGGALLSGTLAGLAFHAVVYLINLERAPYLLLRDSEAELSVEKKARETADKKHEDVQELLRQEEEYVRGMGRESRALQERIDELCDERDQLKWVLELQTPRPPPNGEPDA